MAKVRGGHGAGWRREGIGLALALAVAGGAAPASAQAPPPPPAPAVEDCRCVDREGREIERCFCVRTPDVEAFRESFRFFGDGDRGELRALRLPARGGAVIGVGLTSDGEDGAAGVRISNVVEGGPADAAGLREGDRIVAVEGRAVDLPGDDPRDEDGAWWGTVDREVERLVGLVGDLEPGEPASFEIERDGRRMTLEVVPERRARVAAPSAPRALVVPAPRAPHRMEELRGLRELREEIEQRRELHGLQRLEELEGLRGLERLEELEGLRGLERLEELRARGGVSGLRAVGAADGLRLVPLNPALGSYFGTDEGVLVTQVAEGTRLGVQPGDVLLEIGDRPVRHPEDVRRVLRSYAPDEPVLIELRRRGEVVEVRGTRGR